MSTVLDMPGRDSRGRVAGVAFSVSKTAIPCGGRDRVWWYVLDEAFDANLMGENSVREGSPELSKEI